MATIRKQFDVEAPADKVWEALEDFWAVHERVAPGFVLRTDRKEGARVVHFANGTSARELLVSCDALSKRLVYSAQSERLKHHNASVEIIPEGKDRCRFVWTTDLLPDALAPYIDGQMNDAVKVMKPALERGEPGRAGGLDFDGREVHIADIPPSTFSSAPVTNLDSSEAR